MRKKYPSPEKILSPSLMDSENPAGYGAVFLNKERFLQTLNEIETLNNLDFFKSQVFNLRTALIQPKEDRFGIVNIDTDGNTVPIRKDILPWLLVINILKANGFLWDSTVCRKYSKEAIC